MEFNALTQTLNNFITAFSGGYSRLMPTVNSLLGILLGIEVVLIGLYWALGGGEQVVNVIKKLLFLCFWIWFVKQFGSLASTFVDSLVKAGLIAGGKSGATSLLTDPSKIASYGLVATEVLVQKLQGIKWDIADAIIFGLSYIFIMLAFLVIAIQVFLTVLEYYLMLALVGIFVPFGISSHTRFMAEKAIGAVIASGVKMMVLSFILAVTEPVLRAIKISGPEITFNELWAVILTTGAIAFLAWNAPGMAAGLLAGSPSLSAATSTQNAMAAGMMGGAISAQMISSTRSAAGAMGKAVGGGARAAGVLSTGAQLGAATAMGGSASKVKGALGGAMSAASSSLVSSTIGRAGSAIKTALADNYQMGSSSAYQATGGTMTQGLQQAQSKSAARTGSCGSASSGPQWAQSAAQMIRKALPQQAQPAGGAAIPKISV